MCELVQMFNVEVVCCYDWALVDFLHDLNEAAIELHNHFFRFYFEIGLKLCERFKVRFI